ncbi:MAG: hypothetical protein WCN88_05680 [Candidatus Falkowbacteria bacterium]
MPYIYEITLQDEITAITLVILIFLFMVLVVDLLKKRKIRMLSIYNNAVIVKTETNKMLKAIRTIKEDAIPGYVIAVKSGIDDVSRMYKDKIDTRVMEVVDSEYFFTAAKAALPNKKWKREFEKYTSNPDKQIVKPNEYEDDILEIVKKTNSIIQKRVTATFVQDLHFGETFIDSKEMKKRVITNNLHQDLFTGLPITLTGIAGCIAVQNMDLDTVADLTKATLHAAFGSEIMNKVTDIIVSWIVAEIGESAFQEFAEATFAAMTGFGVVFTLYKIFKYSVLAKRLFVEKEPLMNIRKSIKSNSVKSIDNISEKIKYAYENQVMSWVIDIENQVVQLNAIASEKEKWAKKYL